MGMNTRGGGGSAKTYLNVYQGDLVIEYNKEEDLVKKLESLDLDPEKILVRQRTKGKNEGKDVFYYIVFDVAGLLTDVSVSDTPFGEFLELEITDVDEKYVISLGDVTSRIAKDFTRRAGGIDLDKELVFGVWSITAEQADNGKSKSGVRMYQEDEKIDYFIDYEDLPEPEQKKRGRKTVWDYTEQENFLYNSLMDWKVKNFGEDVEKAEEEPAEEPKATKRTKRQPTKEKVKDDLPF